MIIRNRCSQNILQLVHNVIKQIFSFNIGFIPIIVHDVTRVYIYAGERATQPYSISGGGGTIFPGSDQLNRWHEASGNGELNGSY